MAGRTSLTTAAGPGRRSRTSRPPSSTGSIPTISFPTGSTAVSRTTPRLESRVRRSTPGITWKDWHPVGGCESAYVAFDPENPVRIYAGCFMGLISEWDARTRAGAQRHGLSHAARGDGLSRHEVPLQLERAHPRLAPRSEGRLPRGERSPSIGRSRRELGRSEPGSHPGRRREAGAGREPHHQ